MWIMKAVKNVANGHGGLRNWARNAWTDFVDILKVRIPVTCLFLVA